MGNRIAILREGSEIAQIDTPEVILSDPADEFVENFLGSGAILKGLTLKKVRDIDLHPIPALRNARDARRGAQGSGGIAREDGGLARQRPPAASMD